MAKLSKILKEGRAKQVNKLDLSMLMEMVEQVYDAIGAKVIVEQETTGKDVIDTTSRETETVDIALPFVQLSEAWGNPNSLQRKDITKFIDQMGVDATPGNPVETLRNRLRQLQNFTTTTLEGDSAAGLPVSQIISNILLLDSLAALVTAGEEEQFSAPAAGFIFEGFLAALAGGKSAQIKPADSDSTEDITIKLGADDDGVPVSLKLLSRSNGKVGGSISDLEKSFGLTGNDLQPPDPTTDTTDEEEEGTDPPVNEGGTLQPHQQAMVLDQNVNGMKYIIVLKSNPKGTTGTKLDFYEFDFTLEKYQKWVADGVINPTTNTKFKIGLTQYIDGPFNNRTGGAVAIVESYLLPSSLQVRLKAQEILKVLYNDFYEILKALKTTTDNLNTYLANPENKAPGVVAHHAADELEQDIIKTTGPTG